MIGSEDLKKIGIVATHFNSQKLDVAIQEAMKWDLPPLLKDFHLIEKAVIDETPEILFKEDEYSEDRYNELMDGAFFDNCDATVRHYGIKSIVAYFAYARYLILNGFNDTLNGMVQKTNDFSIPKPLKELEQFADKYRNFGTNSAKFTNSYIFHNKDILTISTYNSCGCGVGSIERNKGYGISAKNINRYSK